MFGLNLSDSIALGAMLIGVVGIIATAVASTKISIARYKAETKKAHFTVFKQTLFLRSFKKIPHKFADSRQGIIIDIIPHIEYSHIQQVEY